MQDALASRGATVTIRPLAVADYEAGPALVERKRVNDLHLSIIERRFWPQVASLRDSAYFAYLLVEGDDLDAGPLRPASVRGALLAVAELGVDVVRSSTADDSAFWLTLLAGRMARRSGAPRRYPRRRAQRHGDDAEAMLAAVPGLSTGSARALLATFGTVEGVAAATVEDWLSVPGIGPVRAAALDRTLRHDRRV